MVRGEKFRNSAYISTLTNQTPEPGGPEFRGLESSGVLWRFFCVAHLSSHSFVAKGIIKQVPRAGCVGIPCVTERTRESKGEEGIPVLISSNGTIVGLSILVLLLLTI